MKIVWFEEAWDDYLSWQLQDKKTIKRINQLIQDSVRNGCSGIGKPICRMAYNKPGTELPT